MRQQAPFIGEETFKEVQNGYKCQHFACEPELSGAAVGSKTAAELW